MRLIVMVFMLVMVVDSLPARADIFVRQHKAPAESEREESKRSWTGIFLRPFRGKSEDQNKSVVRRSQEAAVNYTRRINQLRMQNAELAESFRMLSYWNESGRKPQTAAEVLSYADAHRAPVRLAMLEARSKRMAPIEAARRKHLADYQDRVLAMAPNPDAVIAFNIAQLEAERKGQSVVRVPGAVPAQGQANGQKQRVRQVYRRPAQDTPARLYNDSR